MDAMSKQPIKGASSDIFVDVEYEKKAAITPGVGLYMNGSKCNYCILLSILITGKTLKGVLIPQKT